MLPPPGTDYQALLGRLYRQGECERWQGKHDRAGHKRSCAKDCKLREHEDGCYGLVWWPLAEPTDKRTHDWQRVHRVRWELAYGPIGVDPATGRALTVDHRRSSWKDCSRLDHLTVCTDGENSPRRWRVRGIGALAN